MAINTAKLRISTPTEPIPPGRGFYQLEEESLYVQVGIFTRNRRFFSYLQSDEVSLDFDREGRLIFIEVAVPRRSWQVTPRLQKPSRAEIADIRWLDFRESIATPSLQTPADRSALRLRFSNRTPTQNYFLAESVILQVCENNLLGAIWVDDIVDDMAGREIASFRKNCRPSVVCG